MTLDEYKAECETMLNGIPPGTGTMSDVFMILRLNKLYELANEGTEEERRQCLEHWHSLPCADKLKLEVRQWDRSKE
jgi:hypothetical protein